MNKPNTLYQTLLILLVATFCMPVHAASKSDLAKEKRWESQIIDSLLVGEAIKLKANDLEFLGLYAEPTTKNTKGAVIILHGIGVHPAWPDVIEPLRTQLPDHGWHTLSLQMPVLSNKATDVDYPPLFPEVPARIQAGVDYLKKKGINNIVLSGHSTGVTMASYYLVTKRDPSVKIFAMVSGGMGVPNDKYSDGIKNFSMIKNIKILDIYGSDDREPVVRAFITRHTLGNDIHQDRYQTLRINGANHFYRNVQNKLVNALERKLSKLIQP